MPPQQSQPSITPGPGGNLDPNYGFIFNPQKPKRHFRIPLPGGSKLARTTFLVVAIAVILFILIAIFNSVFGGNGINTKQLVDVEARAMEINRVSTLIVQLPPGSVDQNTVNLAATTTNSLASEQFQLSAYLLKKHIRASTKSLNQYLNKSTDTQFQSALQTNTLSSVYNSYLKTHLADYQNTLKTIFPSSPPGAQTILNDASISATTILAAPQLASAQP